MNNTNNVTAVEGEVYNVSSIWYIIAFIAFAFLLIYIFVFVIITVYPSDFKNPYYTLVQALALSDFYSLFFIIYGALFQYMISGSTLNRIFLFIYQWFGWSNSVHLHFCIGVNRFCAIVFFAKYKHKFTVTKSLRLAVACILAGIISICPQFLFSRDVTSVIALVYCNVIVSTLIIIYIISTVVCLKIVRKCSDVTKVSYIREMKMLFFKVQQ